MAPLLLWTQVVAVHLLLSTATDTQTDARRKPTRQQQHRQKPIPPAAVEDALPLHTPPPSAPNLSSAQQQVLWVTGNVWKKNDGRGGGSGGGGGGGGGGGEGGGTTRRNSHRESRKLRRNETTTVERNRITVFVSPPSPPALRRLSPTTGIQDGKRASSRHAEAPKSVTARAESSLRQKTPHDPPSLPPPSPTGFGLGKDGAVPCREVCDTSRCPQVEAEACKGLVVKDNCNCCPVCVATKTNQSKNEFSPPQKHPSNACDGMVCEKSKVCILNIQGIPMCRCRNIYICRGAERRPICTVNGTFKNKCFLEVEECNTGKRIRVVHRGACRARSPSARQAKPYL